MFGKLRPQNSDRSQSLAQAYGGAYCGLCHSLKSDFGQLGTLLLTYDLAFLSLLWTLQAKPEAKLDAPNTESRRCTTLPWRTIEISRPHATRDRLLSSLTVVLACQKLSDDRDDEGSLIAKIGLKTLETRLKKARENLLGLGFSVQDLDAYLPAQNRAETSEYPSKLLRLRGVCEPTECVTTTIYHSGAQLLGLETDKKSIRFSSVLGRAIYLADAIEDEQKDKKAGSFNPLLDTSGLERKQIRNYLQASASELESAWHQICGQTQAWSALDDCLKGLSTILRSFGTKHTFVGGSLLRSGHRRKRQAGFLKTQYHGNHRCEYHICSMAVELLSQYRCPCIPEPKALEFEEPPQAPKSALDQKLEFQAELPVLPLGDYVCPGCEATPMTRVEIGRGGLFYCDACGGTWINPLHLHELQDHPESKNYVTFPQAGAPPEKIAGSRICPTDREVLIISREKGVSVEECPSCECWYLDPGELGSLL